MGAGVAAGEGAGDARLKVLSDNLFRGRAVRSKPMPESGREGGAGAGEEGRLVGRKNDGLTLLRVSACIVAGCFRCVIRVLCAIRTVCQVSERVCVCCLKFYVFCVSEQAT